MSDIHAFIVGLERYNQPFLPVRGPAASAIAVANRLIRLGAHPRHITLFLDSISSLDDEVRALRAGGFSVRESPLLRDIETYCHQELPAGKPPGSRLFVYWCGHGVTTVVDGTRAFVCRSQGGHTSTAADDLFNASAFLRDLHSTRFDSFAEQLFVADVCGSYTREALPPGPAPLDAVLGMSQVRVFATEEGEPTRASGIRSFTTILLRVLESCDGWPPSNDFLRRLFSELEEAGRSSFWISADDGKHDVPDSLLGPTLTRCGVAANTGNILGAIEGLRSLHWRLQHPISADPAWRRAADATLRKVVSMPLLTASFPSGVPASIDVSDQDCYLAVGTTDGGVFAKRLAVASNADGSPMSDGGWKWRPWSLREGFQSPFVSVLEPDPSCPVAEVEFLPGGVVGMPLVVRRGERGSTHYWCSPEKPGIVTRSRELTNQGSLRDFEFSASLSQHDLLTVASSGSSRSGRLGLPTDDHFCGLEVVRPRDRHHPLVACVSRLGMLYLVDLDESTVTSHNLHLDGVPHRIYIAVTPSEPLVVVETDREVVLVEAGSRHLPIQRFAAGDRTISCSACVRQASRGFAVVLGFVDGSVDVHQRSVTETPAVRSFRNVHRSAVSHVREVAGDALGFCTASRDSIAIWGGHAEPPNQMIVPGVPNTSVPCFTASGRYLITGHEGTLMMWDLTDGDNRFSQQNLLEGVDRADPLLNVSCCVSNGEIWVLTMGEARQLMRDGTVAYEGPRLTCDPELVWRSVRLCWPATKDVALAIQFHQKGDPFLEWVSFRREVVRLQFDEHDHVMLSEAIYHDDVRPTTLGSDPLGQTFAIGYEDGTVVEVDPIRGMVCKTVSEPEVVDAVGRRVESCLYSADGAHLASVTRSGHGWLMNRSSGHLWRFGELLNDSWLGDAVAFSPDGHVMFVGLEGEAGVASFAIHGERPTPLRRYHALTPPTVVTSGARLLILRVSPNNRWLVASRWNTLTVWDMHATETTGHCETTKRIRRLTFLPDGDSFLTIDADGQCVVWDAASGKIVAVLTDRASEENNPLVLRDGSAAQIYLRTTSAETEVLTTPLYRNSEALANRLDALTSVFSSQPSAGG